jgi:glycogen synthase
MTATQGNPRILIVTPEVTYLPDDMGNIANYLKAKADGLADVSAALVSSLFDQGANVHVVLPNYRAMFNHHLPPILKKDIKTLRRIMHDDRIHLAEDRGIDSAYFWQHLYYEQLARLAYGASDFVMMPSRFEPCGLPQMIGPIYSSLPVTHDTGGIHDTITHLDVESNTGNGFLFKDFDSNGLLWAIGEAIQFYNSKHTDKQKFQLRPEKKTVETHDQTIRVVSPVCPYSGGSRLALRQR